MTMFLFVLKPCVWVSEDQPIRFNQGAIGTETPFNLISDEASALPVAGKWSLSRGRHTAITDQTCLQTPEESRRRSCSKLLLFQTFFFIVLSPKTDGTVW